MLLSALTALFALAPLALVESPAQGTAAYPPDTKHTARGIWAKLGPKLEAVGLKAASVVPSGAAADETVGFGINSKRNWFLNGLIVHDTHLAADTYSLIVTNEARTGQFLGPIQSFELEPGVQGIVRERVTGHPGGESRFVRGHVIMQIVLTKEDEPLMSGGGGKGKAALEELEAFSRNIYALIPDQGEAAAKSDFELALLDPNPAYYTRDPVLTIAGNLKAVALTLPHRKGAAADGVSLLLVRAIVPEKGKVTFSLEGKGANGTLHPMRSVLWDDGADYPFRDGGSTSVEVETERPYDPDSHGALALFKPPRDFGPGAGGTRELIVRAVFKPENPSKTKLEATAPLTVIRPPVLLVHGTYDNPKDCWADLSPGHPPTNAITMLDRLKKESFRVVLADYRDSSGSQDPSSFSTNSNMLWSAPGKPGTSESFDRGGIKESIEAFRKDDFAATRADVICHSLGGALARVYLSGGGNAEGWRNREANYFQGDVNRLLTISSTHRGSEVVELFDAYSKYADSQFDYSTLWIDIFLGYVDKTQQRIFTGAPLDQVPGSRALRAIGPTRVRAHAISCVASDEDLDTYGGLYFSRAQKLWWGATPEAIMMSIGQRLGSLAAANRLIAAKTSERALEDRIGHMMNLGSGPEKAVKVRSLRAELDDMKIKNAFEFRRVVFRGPNDCTVSQTSSSGGLAPPFQTTIEHVLHGYASQYPSVQNRVVELLESEGDKFFTPDGFPDTWAQKPGTAPTWGQLLAPPAPRPGSAPAPK